MRRTHVACAYVTAKDEYEDGMPPLPVKKSRRLKLPVMKGEGGMIAGIRPDSNRSILDAADGRNATAYLLSEPANAKHLMKSIGQYRAGYLRVKSR